MGKSSTSAGTNEAAGDLFPAIGGRVLKPQRRSRTDRLECLAGTTAMTYSRLAMRSARNLDRTFRALADGTRRSMLHALAQGEVQSASELGSRFRSAQPTISKHL